jgi:hypothetical protein
MNRFKGFFQFLKQHYMQVLATLIFFGTLAVLAQYATQMITDVGVPREVETVVDAGEANFDEEGIALPTEEELFHE